MCTTKLADSTLVAKGAINARKTTYPPESIKETPATAEPPGGDTSPVQEAVANDMPLIREHLTHQHLSPAAQDIILASWRTGTTKQYRSYLTRWQNFCHNHKLSPYNPGTAKAIDFLTELFNSGIGHSAINTARSALSTIILPKDGIPFGKDPLVCRFLKGVFEIRPCLPKYSHIWDTTKLLCHLKTFPTIETTSLKDLTRNLTTLLCILTGQRCQTIHKIDPNFIQFHGEECVITIQEVLKHTKAGKHQAPLQFRS